MKRTREQAMRAEQAGRIARKSSEQLKGLAELLALSAFLELAGIEETEALARIEDHSADL
jgi:hypothetical protein